MAQQNNSVNLLIHDSSGQQQIIKVMQSSSGKPLTTAGVKAIVKEVTGQDATRVLGQKMSGQSQGIHAVSGQGHSTKNQSMPGNHQNKTIRLTPSQVSALKTVHGHPAAQRIIEVSTAPIMPSSSANKKLPTTSSGSSSVQTSRRRKTDKVGRGLRHFSMKVCEKVKEKGITTYNEVADELVAEEIEGQPIDPMNYDQKNIRRRVYDALNVLMAMNIISKEKKEIRWIGLPTNSIQQCTTLEHENQIRKERIDAKHQQLRELLLQQVSFKTLITRNKEAEERGLIPTPSSAIQLPFIIVNTHKKTHINCSISNDKSEYFFKFDDKFEIHDDVEVLKRMGLLLGLDKGECAFDDIERAKTMVPKAFEKYIEMYGRGQDESLSDDWDMSYNETIMENEVILPKTEYCDDDEDDEEIVASEISDVD